MDTGPAAVAPQHGDFLHLKSKFAGEEKNLGIESPALDFLQREDGLDGGLAEGFESALRIGELEAERDAQQEIEDAAEDLAMQGLALRLGFGAQPARTDGDVSAGFDGCEEFYGFLNRRGEIGVAEENDAALSVEHAVADAVALAAVAGIFDEMNDRIMGGEAADDFRGIVGRAIIYHDDFSIPLLSVNVGEDLLERGAEARALVIGRDDDAVFGAHFVTGSSVGPIPTRIY